MCPEDEESMFSEMSLNIYQTTWCHIPKENNFQLIYRIVIVTLFKNCLLSSDMYVADTLKNLEYYCKVKSKK
jgi:hypothetical protein